MPINLLKRYEISFRCQGVETVSEGEGTIHGEMTANAVQSSYIGSLMWVLSEHRFFVYALSCEEAITALQLMSPSLAEIKENPRRIQCVGCELADRELSIGRGAVLAFGSKIIDKMPLGGEKFAEERLLYPVA
ncbi:MAG: hypothetical protein Q7S83_03080 [bacterium]|nr:hypothetical protein [bacterium]